MSNDFGGRMTLRFSSGVLIALRANVNISPSRVSIEAIANQDGSVDRSATVKAGTCEISFADAGQDLDALLSGDRFNATLIEEFGGNTHYFTKAFIAGDPTINRITGEVTGAVLNYETYRKTSA
ncbi:phage tail tube protein [Agrobacterium sp. AGB01]|uniref:phage tail tube protein n=1 Tax=Agrobacterium sp. AGB01 TaxID=2769302 RepID=UPI0017804CDB|nr:phage tail tube protein [Agrobacterium sp. AGB01]MBD9390129.1 phage tail tube protein [Agrobacterium sp. AGB01]